MIEPLAAAYGTTSFRQTVLVHVVTDVGSGWGECVALNEPTYAADWSNGEWGLLKEIFAPALLNAGDINAESVGRILAPFKHHHTGKAAIEMAVLDAQLRAQNVSLAEHFGATVDSVACSIVVGLIDGDELIRTVARHLDRGYKMLKLKIKPGKDIERVDALQSAFPNLPIRVDANGSYDWFNEVHRKALFDLAERNIALIEQPFAPDRALPVQQFMLECNTPVALDESITSWEKAINALEMGLCDVLTIKPGMLGGYLVAKRLRDEAHSRGVPTMIGGMVETALARSANLALAASEDNTEYPAEIAPDGRWFNDRLNLFPVDMVDGRIKVPSTPGVIGELDYAVMDKLTRRFHVSRIGGKSQTPKI